MARAATVVDVAERAGVSVGTVSRYLNGAELRPAKRDAVEKAIRDLRYNRNAAAKAMRTDKTNIVALLVPGYDEFFAAILASLSRTLAADGQVLLTHKHEGDARALGLAMEFFQTHRVNAVVTPGVEEVQPQVEALLAQGIPVVFFNNDVPGLRVDRVFSRNADGARKAVKHLIDLGHTRIAMIRGERQETSAEERHKGYLAALADAGISARGEYVVGGTWRRQDAFSGITRLMELPEPPTAVFTANYVLAFAVLDYLRENGLKVGEDLSLLSFDDVEPFRQMTPGVTAVAQPAAAIGEAIGEIVLDHVAGREHPQPRTVGIDCTIILRETTRPPKVR